MSSRIKLELVYALPGRQFLKSLEMKGSACIRDVIEQSGVLEEYTDLDIDTLSAGIFGKKKSLDTRVKDNDRVEIYRPLLIDPKEARRRRAQLKKSDI